MNNETFPGFAHSAAEIASYICDADRFVVTIRPCTVTRYRAKDAAAFRKWLKSHRIKDITSEVGTLTLDIYFKENIYSWDY
jgi:hypothetical protein